MVNLHLTNAVIKNLTRNELDILQFIYKNPQQIPDMSIQTFAAAVSYSTATVLRFCKKLGYSGFAELKYTLRQQTNELSCVTINTAENATNTACLLDTLSQEIESTARLIQDEQLYQTFRFLDSDCSFYLWAPGGVTSILTDYFEKLLFSIGRQKVYKIDAFRIGEHILHHLPAKALLILISITGDFTPTKNLAKLAHMNDIPVLSITPCTNNAIAAFSTIHFHFFTNQRENCGAEFTSRLPAFYVIQLIVRAYLQYLQELPSHSKELPAAADRSNLHTLPLFRQAHDLALTETEQQILDYMENHLLECAFFGLKDLEQRLYTSGATIVRFCQKLGIQGFNELKYQIRSCLGKQQDPLFFANGLISHSIARFHDNVENSDTASLDTIADLLTSGRPVYIYGNALSSIAAKYLHAILTALDSPSILLEWPHLLTGLASEMSSNSILFLITAHGDTRYLSALEKTKEQGICSILLTCEADSPLLKACTYGLCANDKNEQYREVDVNTRLGMLTIIQIFIELIVRKK